VLLPFDPIDTVDPLLVIEVAGGEAATQRHPLWRKRTLLD
jgi:hypothetical protein